MNLAVIVKLLMFIININLTSSIITELNYYFCKRKKLSWKCAHFKHNINVGLKISATSVPGGFLGNH